MPCIEIIVSVTGQSQVQTQGFQGADCRTGSQFLERALGRTTHEQLTPEYYQGAGTTEVTEAQTV